MKNVAITLLVILLSISVFFNLQKRDVPLESKSDASKPTQLTAEALFQKKQECQKYKQQIEKEFEAEEARGARLGMQTYSKLDKIFYSQKVNSCLYVATRHTLGPGPPREDLRLVDALSGELLFWGGGGAPGTDEYDQKRESFWNAVKGMNDRK